MNNKIKNYAVIISMTLLVAVLSVLCFFGPKADFLDAERREPAAFPELSVDSVMKDGKEYSDSFMSKFESYSLDTFPFRDFFRTVNEQERRRDARRPAASRLNIRLSDRFARRKTRPKLDFFLRRNRNGDPREEENRHEQQNEQRCGRNADLDEIHEISP